MLEMAEMICWIGGSFVRLDLREVDLPWKLLCHDAEDKRGFRETKQGSEHQVAGRRDDWG